VNYSCPVCLEPIEPGPAGDITIAGLAEDEEPTTWDWGPYPVHPTNCATRLFTAVKHRVNRNGALAIPQQVQADSLRTGELLAHWAEHMNSPFVGRTHLHHMIRILERPATDGVTTPWPEMDNILNLRPGHVSCLGTRSRSREAQAGYDTAVHNAARGLQIVLFAPDLTPRNPVPGLTINRSQTLTVEHVKSALAGKAHQDEPVDLVVIDRLQTMSTARQERVCTPDDAEQVSKELKRLAMDSTLGHIPVLLIARLERPRRTGHPVEIDDLGIGAELEYHADTLTLVDRTEPSHVQVLVAKDRSGPAPRVLTVHW